MLEAAATACGRRSPTAPSRSRSWASSGAGFVGNLGLWVDLVRVPPSGTWERRRADILALAETWVGPSDATEGEGLTHLVRAYLRAFGPAAWRDIAAWAGISVEEAKLGGAEPGADRLPRRGRAPAGRPRGRHRCPNRRRRRRCASCRTGTPTCSSTPDGPASCPRPSARASSTSRTRSRSASTSSMARRRAPGRCARAHRRAGPVPRPDGLPRLGRSSRSARRSRRSTPEATDARASRSDEERRAGQDVGLEAGPVAVAEERRHEGVEPIASTEQVSDGRAVVHGHEDADVRCPGARDCRLRRARMAGMSRASRAATGPTPLPRRHSRRPAHHAERAGPCGHRAASDGRDPADGRGWRDRGADGLRAPRRRHAPIRGSAIARPAMGTISRSVSTSTTSGAREK